MPPGRVRRVGSGLIKRVKFSGLKASSWLSVTVVVVVVEVVVVIGSWGAFSRVSDGGRGVSVMVVVSTAPVKSMEMRAAPRPLFLSPRPLPPPLLVLLPPPLLPLPRLLFPPPPRRVGFTGLKASW
jgi:hypothetical protein